MSNTTKQEMPNPQSLILSASVIAGAGIGIPTNTEIPEGMGAVLLLVPLDQLKGKSPVEIQEDIGLPWHAGNGEGVWFKDSR